jgi:hypothetical protein
MMNTTAAPTAIPISAPLVRVMVAVAPPGGLGRPPAAEFVLVAVAVAGAPDTAVVMVVTPPFFSVLVTTVVLVAPA